MVDSAEMTVSPRPTGDPTRERLDDQINWYDRKSTVSQRYFYALKLVTIVAAAMIPLLAGLSVDPEFSRTATAALGALIVVIEGLQQLYQLQTNWLRYRSTCESLRHEKYLFLAGAGAYGVAVNPHSLLAERIELLVSEEHAKWASTQTFQKERLANSSPKS